MPELPEVETTARSLRARVIGRRVRCVGGVDWPRTPEGSVTATNDPLDLEALLAEA